MQTSARQPEGLAPPLDTGAADARLTKPSTPEWDFIHPELRAALVRAQVTRPERSRAAQPVQTPAVQTPAVQTPAVQAPAVQASPVRQQPLVQPARRNEWLTPAAIFGGVVTVLLYLGWRFPTERYITPKSGIGYALGIIGGSFMLLLLLYSARKRIPWLNFMGATAGWFRFHMVLGVLGPLCILYHANFGLGAANSNVALFCMLTVAGSGLIGRYIYARIHHGLYGSKLDLGELRKGAESLRSASGAFAFLPELVEHLEATERRLLSTTGKVPVLGIARLVATAAISMRARLRLRGYVRKCLRAASARSTTIAAQRKRLRRTAFAYIDRRLTATRRVAGLEAYERLFSLWHALHLPLMFIMLIAGTVHVIAVHVY
jgi:hypothetical protein